MLFVGGVMSSRSRHYWDTCLFLDLINSTPGRHEVIEGLLDDLSKEDARIEAITSALTVAEVAYATAEKKGRSLDPATLARIDAFWAPESLWKVVELYPAVAYEARGMIREGIGKGVVLKPHDAIHFATAKRLHASIFFTYDEKLYKFDKSFGFAVKEPSSPYLRFSRAGR